MASSEKPHKRGGMRDLVYGAALDGPVIETTVARQGRVYDYLAGGRANFAVDRELGERQARAYGQDDGSRARRDIRANRDFIRRAVEYLAGEAGVRQFLDIGTGTPKDDDLHRVAPATAPGTRTVFIDNDDVVLAHAHELMWSTQESSAHFALADFYEPQTVLTAAAQTLDLDEPVALMVVALLHLHGDDRRPHDTLARYLQILPPGSFLAMSHLAADIDPEATGALRQVAAAAGADHGFHPRPRAEVERFFQGLDVVEPGIVPVSAWRNEEEFVVPAWAAVGRKP